jgi:uncharacterized metal-binding protein
MLEEKDICCSGGVKTLILGCSGGSNVGQISNNVMIELDRKGVGNAYCLAGIGAGLTGFIESAKAAKTIVIDGCPVGCGKKAFEKYGLEPSQYFVVTELGIAKTHDFSKLEDETKDALNPILSHIHIQA